MLSKIRSFFVSLAFTTILFVNLAAEEQEITDFSVRGAVLRNTRFEIGYSAGKFIEIDQSYPEIGLFVPVFVAKTRMAFADARAYRLDNGRLAVNGGLGFRTWGRPGWVWGANIYYDHRESIFLRPFQRIGVGLEWLTSCWDIRVNGYFSICSTQFRRVEKVFRFVGGFISKCSHTQFSPNGGFDAEIGVPLGCWCDFSLYGAIGPYYYRQRFKNNFWGGQARLQLGWKSYLFFQVRTSYDHINHSHTQGTIFLCFPFDVLCCCCIDDPCQKLLAQPVRRQGIIMTERCCVYENNF